MGKYTQFEVTTPVDIISPKSLMEDVANIGHEVFDRPTGGLITMWSGGKTFETKGDSLKCVDQDKLKYYHISRVADPFGITPLDFLALSRQLDPKLSAEDRIGTEDLQTAVGRILIEKTGFCTLSGGEYKFDYLDALRSAKYPGFIVFALRQLHGEPDNSLTQKPELITVTEIAERKVREISPDIADLHRMSNINPHEIEDTIPIARIANTNKDLIAEFRETFTANLLDPYITVTANQLDISTIL